MAGGWPGGEAVVMWGLAILAQAGRVDRDPLRQPEVIWGTAGLAVALLVGAAFVYAVDKWRQRTSTRSVADPSGELTEFRGMFERGEITDQEYADLRDRVAKRMKTVPPTPALPGLIATLPRPQAAPEAPTEVRPEAPGSAPPPAPPA